MSTTPQRQRGNSAEDLVARTLEGEGFTILARNYTRRNGEIDIIASTDTVLVFVEVKMRTSAYFDLSEVITPSKQRKIIAVAQDYIARNDVQKMCRFDVALVKGEQKNATITYLDDAFQGSDY